MWMDRLGAHAGAGAPSPAYNRSYSPGGRPPSHLAGNRPTFSPRSSSLSLASTPNASTNSLPAALHQTGGSAARLDTRKPTETTVRDPLDVLDTIIGRQRAENGAVGNRTEGPSGKPEELVESIDFEDTSLEQFVGNGEESEKSMRGAAQAAQPIEQCELQSIYSKPGLMRIISVNTFKQLRENKIGFRNFIIPSLYVRPLPWASLART